MFWKKKKNPAPTVWTCPVCGQSHDTWPALAFGAPANYENLSEEQQTNMATLDSDFCVINHEDQVDRFIRVTLVQQVNDACEDLEYGLWVSLSEASFTDYEDNFNNPNHETGYFGWLCSYIPGYDDTTDIPCDVLTQPNGNRPLIFPHKDFDHPFVRDFYNGISKTEAERRVREMLENLEE